MKICAVCMGLLRWLCGYPGIQNHPHPQALLATQVVPPGLRRPQGCSRTVCKPRGVFLALVKTILKSHFPLIKYGFVLQMHA